MMPRFPTAPLAALALAASLAITLAACGNDRDEPVAKPEADAEIVARVNERPITRADLSAYAGLEEDPAFTAADGVLDELISLELMRQEAQARGLHEEEETRRILRMVETNLLASLLMERLTTELEITEDDLRDEYERQIAMLPDTEYRARHILVEDEETAREILAALDAEEDFAALAETHSIDPGSAARGGELGWFTPDRMVPEFGAAVEALEPGETGAEPVQSQFGWHVIRLDETREADLPAFADVRAELIEILESRAIQQWLEDARADADIEIPERPAN